MKRQTLQFVMMFMIAILISSNVARAQNSKSMTEETVVREVTIYKFKDGISEQEALEATSSVNDFLKSQDGFISRRCLKTMDGRWIDLIIWETTEKAEKAAGMAMKTPVCLAFFAKTDESSTTFLLAEEQFFIE